jgi:membrane fusion protein (multidrug efflux system)
VDQLSVRAPQAGVIGDVRIRSGQLLSVGDVVVTLVGDQTRYSIVAMLPAQYRPQLRPGMSLRFEVNGYRYAYQEMSITSVGTQIIGPNEVKRYLGQQIDDTVKIEGPVVLVEAEPPAPTFEVDGRTFEFYHGMGGVAEARVRSESILLSLLPSLRVIVRGLRG